MNTNTTFTPQEFYAQVCEFRDLGGDRRFWAKPEETRDAALKGFTHCYFNTTPTEEHTQERLAMVFDRAIKEHSRRESMVLFRI